MFIAKSVSVRPAYATFSAATSTVAIPTIRTNRPARPISSVDIGVGAGKLVYLIRADGQLG